MNDSIEKKGNPWQKKQKRLADQIKLWLDGQKSIPINMSVHRHTAIVPVLRQLVYDTTLSDTQLRLNFLDQSEAARFPLGILAENEYSDLVDLPILRLGLISFRHPEMDFFVDQYLLTNKEIDRNASMAETEMQAYSVAVKTLSDVSIDSGAIIHVYHTGLEPSIIGFYRGVVEILKQRKQKKRSRTLRIVPCMFVGRIEESPWTEKSSGSLIDSYFECKPWY